MEGRTETQLVRERRIRRGTLAPGPRPLGSGGHADLLPGPGETLDRLAGDFCLFQLHHGHRYSTDDLLCAYFACEAAETLGVHVERALDLGSGIGSVALLLAWRLPQARVDGIEAQPASVALAERSIRWNGLVDRVQVRQGDLRHRSSLAPAAYELVTGTPPYLAPERGVISPMPQRGECRFELRGGVERYLEAAAYALRPGGLATLVQAWRDHERVLRRAGELGLVPALSQPVVFREHREPAIGLYAFTHAAVEWELDPLLVRGSDGAYSEAFRTVRRKMGYPLEQGFASGS